MSKASVVATVILLFVWTGISRAERATVTVSGVEQNNAAVFDSGSMTVTANGFPETIFYGKFSTSASLASAIAAKFSQDCNSPVIALANGAAVTFVTRDPAALLTMSAPAPTWDSQDFTTASFAANTPSPTLPPNFTPTIQCSPNVAVTGENVTCDVSLVVGAMSPVGLSINGAAWTTATPDPGDLTPVSVQICVRDHTVEVCSWSWRSGWSVAEA